MSDFTRKNKGLSRYAREKLLRAFAEDLTAAEAAQVAGVNRNTANRYFALWRAAIHDRQTSDRDRQADLPPPLPAGSGTRLPAGLEPVVGLFERDGRVFAEIAPPMLAVTLEPVLRGRMPPGRAPDAPGWRGYDALAGWSRGAAVRVAGEPGAAEAFWAGARARLKRFRGVTAPEVHLSECVWRWGKDAAAMRAVLRTLS